MATKENVGVLETDLDTEFDKHISLYNLVGQSRACQTLKTLIDEYHWNQGGQNKIKPIMLYGQHSCSVVARAFANSLGAVEFNEIMGCLIGYGISFQCGFENTGEHSAYYISDIDKMVYYWQAHLFKLLKERIIEEPAIPNVRECQRKYFAGQLILSSEKQTKISSKLEKYCSAVIQMIDYEDQDVRNILLQRIAVCGLKVEDQPKIVDAIVQAVKVNNVEMAIQLLEWAYKCSRAEGADTIVISHFNKALKILG